MKRLLELRGVRAAYGARAVLHGVDLHVEAGRITALLGANGAGKSTVLRAISRLVRTQGDLVFDGTNLSPLQTEAVARLGIAHVPEGRGTFASLSVIDNLRMGSLFAARGGGQAWLRTQRELVFHYFPRLAERQHQQAGTLSGGEQQMLAIGRALMSAPRLLMLDEPSMGLAPAFVKEIFSIMRHLNAEQGLSMLLVEQNAVQALALAHSAFVIETGSLVLGGSASEIAADAQVRKAYLGG